MPTSNLIIEPIDPLHPDAIFILHEAAREIRPLYADNIDTSLPLPSNDPAVPRSLYLIARLDGNPVGSAALSPLDETTTEVRRMYVLPTHKRKGIARLLLEHIEKTAIAFGYSNLRLETGNRQFAAIELYQSCGYRAIPPFGEYSHDPTSVCFEKVLTVK